MKKILVVAALAMVFAGCVKSELNNSQKKEGDRVEQLIVPASFDWKTTKEVEFGVVSSSTARVAVSTSPGGEPFATFFAGGGVKPLSLSVPAGVETLYVSYQKIDNSMSTPAPVAVLSNNSSYTISSGNRPFDDSDMDTTTHPNVIFIPAVANGWGTMFFEDMWPSYGDYDFNDFVFNYKVQLHLNENNMVEAMQIGVRMNACSGSFPYELYLQMHGVTSDKISEVITQKRDNSQTAQLTLLPTVDPNKNRALMRFDGIKRNTNNKQGAMWLNTEPGYEISIDKLVQLSTVVYFSEPLALANVSFSGFDFFLAQVDEQGQIEAEIHRCNFEPINTDYYYSNAKNMSSREFYKSKDNLIWGVNIPFPAGHTYEKTNFLDAYPQFKAWAQSSGELNKEWYKNADKKYIANK